MSLESIKWKKSEPLSDIYWSSDVPVVPPKCTCSEVKKRANLFQWHYSKSYSRKQQVMADLQSN